MVNKKTSEKTIEEITKELIKNLKVDATISVTKVEDNFKVQLDTPDTGLLIGYHGEVINSLQLLLGVIAYRKLGEWVRIMVDVGDYREKREEVIRKMALDKAEEVVVKGESITLPYLSPLERRIVHMAISENQSVTSYSEGEGKERRVIIAPRKPGQ